MEEGYRLGKDKGYKEYKVQVEEEEAENQARKDIAGYQNTLGTPGNVTSADVTSQTDSAAPEACASTKTSQTTHTTTTSSNSITTATKRSDSYSAASRNSKSSIPPFNSSSNAQIIEITDSPVNNSPTSSNTTKTAYLNTENPSNDISDSYVAYSTHKLPPAATKVNRKKPTTQIPKNSNLPSQTPKATEVPSL
jgi:hypothetical protein